MTWEEVAVIMQVTVYRGCGGRGLVAFWTCCEHSCQHLVILRVRELGDEMEGGVRDSPKVFSFLQKDGCFVN